MSLFGYLAAGGLAGFGKALTDQAEEARRKAREDEEYARRQAERAENRSWELADRADDRGYREKWRDEQRGFEASERGRQGSADAGALGVIYGADAGFKAQPGTLGELLLRTESNSFDTLFGHSQRDGGKFAGIKPSEMTLAELEAFTDVNGEYGQWVKGKVGRVATPVGAGQIVGTTMRRAAKALNLPPDTKFTPEVQMQMVDFLAREAISGPKSAEGKRKALRGVWEGFKSVNDAELDRAIEAYEAGNIGVTFDKGNTDLIGAASNPDASPGVRSIAVSELDRRGRPNPAVKLTGEEWRKNKDGTETRYGQDDKGVMRPYTMPDGTPFTRDPETVKKPKTTRQISATLVKDIDKWAVDDNQYPPETVNMFVNEVERLINEDASLTERQAFFIAQQNAEYTDIKGKPGWFGREAKVIGRNLTGFRDPNAPQPPRRGFETMADDAPTMPSDAPRATPSLNAGQGSAPDPASLQVGQVIGGYEYIGGDPAVQTSWRKVATR